MYIDYAKMKNMIHECKIDGLVQLSHVQDLF